MKLEEAEAFIKEGRTIEEFVEKIDWKDFEKFVKEIFSAHGFGATTNFRFKTKKRFEIDIIATRNNFILLADCKEWNKGWYKNSGLRKAAEDQIQRYVEFEKFFRKNPIAKSKFKLKENPKITPLIVTWHDETIAKHKNCFIVPVWKLNRFLSDYNFY